MRRILFFCWILFTPTLWAASASSYLPDLQNQYQHAQLVSAEFTQRKQIKFIETELISTGSMRFAKGRGFIWQLDTPFFSKTMFLPKAIYKIDAKGRVSHERDPSAKAIAQLLQSLLAGDWRDLDNMFAVDKYNAGAQWSLELHPAQAWLARALDKVILFGKENILERIEIVDSNTNVTSIELSNIKSQNEKLSPKQEAYFAAPE